MSARFNPSPARIAAARQMYDDGAPKSDIAKFLKITVPTLTKYMAIWGWEQRAPKEASAADCEKNAPSELRDPAGTRALARRVETAVRTELGAIEKRLGSSTAASAERNARMLASLVKSLAELRKLDREDADARNRHTSLNEERDSPDDGDAKPPADLARLREELAQDIERIRARERAARSDGQV